MTLALTLALNLALNLSLDNIRTGNGCWLDIKRVLALGGAQGGGRTNKPAAGLRDLQIGALQLTRDTVGAGWTTLIALDTTLLALVATIAGLGMGPSRTHARHAIRGREVGTLSSWFVWSEVRVT